MISLWKLNQVDKIIRKQQDNGSWKYSGSRAHIRSSHHYNQLETYRILGQHMEKYGVTNEHPAIRKAADSRGIYQAQYTPNYSAAIMELLIKTGSEDDPRIERGFDWLLLIRQHDDGWTIPIRTIGINFTQASEVSEPIQPDKSRHFSHCITGVVLRAFATYPRFKRNRGGKICGTAP